MTLNLGINLSCCVIILIYGTNHGHVKLNDHFGSNKSDLEVDLIKYDIGFP